MKELTPAEIKYTIKQIIANDLDMNIDMQDIDDSASLYDDGLGLDSIAIINFIVLIEKKFDISFQEHEISAQLFRNVDSLTAFVASRIDSPIQPAKRL